MPVPDLKLLYHPTPSLGVLIISLSGQSGFLTARPSKAAPGHHVSVLAAEFSAAVYADLPQSTSGLPFLGRGQFPPEQVRAGNEQSSSSLAGEGCEGAILLLPVE